MYLVKVLMKHKDQMKKYIYFHTVCPHKNLYIFYFSWYFWSQEQEEFANLKNKREK
jgi:hypothetical protein